MKLKSERSDVFAEGVAPDEVRECLVEAGGLNPYGEPIYRLTIAEQTRFLQGGEWSEWPDGISLQDRGGIHVDEGGVVRQEPPGKPLRVVTEMRWIVRYPVLEGWILQEWFPSHHYGAPEDWYKYTVHGHPELCRLGPYPEQGDYELALPFGWGQAKDEHVKQIDPRFQGRPGLPTLHALRMAIAYGEHCRNYWSLLKPEARIRMRENQELEHQALRERWEHDRRIDLIRDAMSPLLSTSLEAGRWREQLVRDGQIKTGHVGN